ncbi:GntR family transcriptional regulator [Aeribacillus alveayuensis]|jgi:GntR family transcriptional regulator|uniref:GntR family transcriptional regulator n=1 Tax=Aeribacillus alveayuensis TaxID=279215 RepID=A0ABT9VQ78_9BACI|nr:GntR family transcriptional regulator [Bacillus alveayuensis]
MFDLDFRSRKPIYEQLVEKFKELIIHEVLKKDEQLPSVRSLAQELTVNPNTIQKAYRELERQGYIFSVKGKGNFVNAISDQINHEELEKVKQQLKKKMSEAFYLGMSKEEMVALMEEAKGGEKG